MAVVIWELLIFAILGTQAHAQAHLQSQTPETQNGAVIEGTNQGEPFKIQIVQYSGEDTNGFLRGTLATLPQPGMTDSVVIATDNSETVEAAQVVLSLRPDIKPILIPFGQLTGANEANRRGVNKIFYNRPCMYSWTIKSVAGITTWLLSSKYAFDVREWGAVATFALGLAFDTDTRRWDKIVNWSTRKALASHFENGKLIKPTRLIMPVKIGVNFLLNAAITGLFRGIVSIHSFSQALHDWTNLEIIGLAGFWQTYQYAGWALTKEKLKELGDDSPISEQGRVAFDLFRGAVFAIVGPFVHNPNMYFKLGAYSVYFVSGSLGMISYLTADKWIPKLKESKKFQDALEKIRRRTELFKNNSPSTLSCSSIYGLQNY